MSRPVICGIYKITSPTGRIYIGQSINIYRRWVDHQACRADSLLCKSILKHGWVNHIFEIIEECEEMLLDEREIFWIEKLNTSVRDNPLYGMNLTIGGGAPMSRISGADHPGAKPCFQYDLDGNFIKCFSTRNAAAKEVGTKNCRISEAIHGIGRTKTAGGFMWTSEDKGLKIPSLENSVRKEIVQFDIEGKFLNLFASIQEAGKLSGMSPHTVARHAKGVTKQGLKYNFVFLKDLIENYDSDNKML